MKKKSSYCSPINCNHFENDLSDILCDIEFIRKGKTEKIGNVPCVFDIEASSFYKDEEKQCTMYAWVLGINGKCIRGRTWYEFIISLNKITEYYKLNIEKRLIIYVHNLSYEFQWFKNYFEWEKVFATDTRKPLYAITKSGIEFRCSYLLSGYSLEKLSENLTKYKVLKKVGDLDYKLIRHSRTPLTEKEWGYILNDGLVVMAYIQEEIERMGNITKIPLTKTGYVRQLCRKKCLQGDNKWGYTKIISKLTMDEEDYKQFKRTYMGGFTHANINYVGKTIKDVHSFDFSSSYPAVMLSEKYPMSEPIFTIIESEEDFKNYLNGFCCMFDCTFYNITAKVDYENYISLSRCLKIENYIVNNGRIVEADMLQLGLTEQDFFIISDMYEWDYIEVSNFKRFYKGYLPKDFILSILELYKNKTELKGIPEKIVEYMVSKNMINSCYGMCVTDPCKDENIYSNNEWSLQKADISSLLEKYNTDKQRFLYYAWGIWITAYARSNLFTGINEFKEDYIYSDTDSIKVINIDRHKTYIENYNKNVTEKINNCLKYYNIDISLSCPKTVKGVNKPMGVWDYEGKYDRFKTLGAKRYITEKDNDIDITIAGVGKIAGKEYLKYTYKTNEKIFNAFTEDLTFPASYENNGEELNGSGKLLHTYIDTYMSGEVIDYLGNKYKYEEQSGVHLENTEYTLSLESEFKTLLLGIKGGQFV